MSTDINTNNGIILETLNEKVDLDGGNYKPRVINFGTISGPVDLIGNRVYAAKVNGATTFRLPEVTEDDVFMEINILMRVENTPTINWGTNYFFYKRAPQVTTGNYDVYYNYDVLLKQWVCSVILKGEAA